MYSASPTAIDRLTTFSTARPQERGLASPVRSIHTILVPRLYIRKLKGMDSITVSARPSSPKSARATGNPIKPLLQKVAQQHHMPRRPSGTRRSLDSTRERAPNRGNITVPTKIMDIPSFIKLGSNGRSMEVMMVAGTVIFISRALKGLDASAGSRPARTAKKPTPIRRNSPIKLDSRTAMSMQSSLSIRNKPPAGSRRR